MKLPRVLAEALIMLKTVPASRAKMDRSNAESIEEARETGKELTVLLHGIFCNYYRQVAPFVSLLKKQGICVVSIGYDYTTDTRRQAEDVEKKIEAVMKEAGVTTINLVGISMGGTVARYYAEGLKNHARIDKLVTAFTPIVLDKNSLAYKIEKIVNPEFDTVPNPSDGIEKSFSVEHQLMLYGTHDHIIGDQYPIKDAPAYVIQRQIPGGHMTSSFNPVMMEATARFLRSA